MDGYVVDLEQVVRGNSFFRKVLFTAQHSQLVLMSLAPSEDIGEEVHELDQFIRVESGMGRAVLNGKSYELKDGSAVVVPAGVRHNILNVSAEVPLKLYTVYSPPEHRVGVVHSTKKDALADHEHFDGNVPTG